MCKKRFINILTFPDGGWLQDRIELEPSPEVNSRRAEIASLVKMVIPQSAFLVHEISLKSGRPQDSLELSNIIASEQYGLSRYFSKKELRELLQKITESSVELLKMKYDSFGHEATS
jgi:nuclear pore complex protein Nup107